MEELSREEYCDMLSTMDRNKLIRECAKLDKKLRKLSEICDVQDVIATLNENTELAIQLKTKEHQIEKLKEVIRAEFDELPGKKPAPGETPAKMVKYLVKVLKRLQQ